MASNTQFEQELDGTLQTLLELKPNIVLEPSRSKLLSAHQKDLAREVIGALEKLKNENWMRVTDGIGRSYECVGIGHLDQAIKEWREKL